MIWEQLRDIERHHPDRDLDALTELACAQLASQDATPALVRLWLEYVRRCRTTTTPTTRGKRKRAGLDAQHPRWTRRNSRVHREWLTGTEEGRAHARGAQLVTKRDAIQAQELAQEIERRGPAAVFADQLAASERRRAEGDDPRCAGYAQQGRRHCGLDAVAGGRYCEHHTWQDGLTQIEVERRCASGDDVWGGAR